MAVEVIQKGSFLSSFFFFALWDAVNGSWNRPLCGSCVFSCSHVVHQAFVVAVAVLLLLLLLFTFLFLKTLFFFFFFFFSSHSTVVISANVKGEKQTNKKKE